MVCRLGLVFTVSLQDLTCPGHIYLHSKQGPDVVAICAHAGANATVSARASVGPEPRQALSRFFFDVHDGKVTLDQTGTELPTLDAAREEARQIVIDLASTITLNRDAVQLRIHVRDEAGARVFTGTMLFLIEGVE